MKFKHVLIALLAVLLVSCGITAVVQAATTNASCTGGAITTTTTKQTFSVNCSVPRPPATTVTATATATVTATATATATVTATVTASPTSTPTSSGSPSPTVTPTPTPTPLPAGNVCTSANAYTNWNGERYDWGTGANGAGSMGEYYVAEDEWGAGGTGLAQHSVFCSHTADGNNPYWYAEASTPAGADGSVKSYPNAHLDFHHWGTGHEPSVFDVDSDPSTPNVLRSSFSHSGPGTCTGCSYDWAQELWLNDYAVEVMIWTQYQTQHPSFADATKVDTVTIQGHTFEVWRAVWGGTGTSRDGYIVFLPATQFSSENWDLMPFVSYMNGKGWLGSAPTLSSVTYGVEICQTSGATKRFDVTDFSVTPLPHIAY